MIIVKLIEGLGNQMFQYAMGRYIAHKNNTKFKLDKIGFLDYKLHEYGLCNFNIKENFATKKEINYFKKYKKSNKKIIRKFYNALFADESKYILEHQFNFIPNIFNAKNNVYLDGFWQSEKYFIDIKDIIKKDFTIKNPSNKYKNKVTQIKSKNSISLHIRRGDYVKNKETLKHHGICSLDYYNKAIQIVKKKLDNPTFFIFSDDIEWVKKNLNTKSTNFFVSGGKLQNYEELILMSKCKHNIIANSSFSWWGAWLNDNPKKIIIAPKKWFEVKKMNTIDLIPDSWIKI